MRYFIAFIIGYFSVGLFYAQETYEPTSYTKQLTLRHDNDFFLLTDRYYSSGLFLSYATTLKKGIFGGDEQFIVRLGQEVYTPSQTQSTSSSLFDRPYAGFTGARGTWSTANEHHLFSMGLLLGIAGNNSGAGGFQRWYHRAVAISDSPLWIDEINNSFHTNLYASHVSQWEIAPNPFGVRLLLVPKVALGTRDIFGEAESILQFGRRSPLRSSIAFNRLGNNDREIFFAFRFGYRRVFYNGLIEGNLFGDSSTILRTPKNDLLLLGFDFNHRFNQHNYKVGFRYNSAEALNTDTHMYVQLSYGFSFN